MNTEGCIHEETSFAGFVSFSNILNDPSVLIEPNSDHEGVVLSEAFLAVSQSHERLMQWRCSASHFPNLVRTKTKLGPF